MLTEEQIKSIKEQITRQIDSWEASEDKKQEARSYINSLNAQQLEQFLIKNKMIKQPKENQTTQEQTPQTTPPQTEQQTQCPFCLIAQNKIPSYKIDENSKSTAVLEINPLSKGHSLIIPKQHKKIEKIPSQAFALAKKTASKIKRKLKPKEISIQSAELFEHGAINIIPIYQDEKLTKHHATEAELKEMQEKLITKPKTKTTQKTKTGKLKLLPQYPKRIP